MADHSGIFPQHSSFPPTLTDVRDADTQVESLRLTQGAKSFDRIKTLPRLGKLWCFGVGQQELETIAACITLQHIYIENFKAQTLSPLKQLPRLQALSVNGATKVKSLDDVADLLHLTGLALVHFKRVTQIEPLSRLRKLTSLAITGSMWMRMTVRSLAPLSALGNLRYLSLVNLKTEDETLRPLEALSKLDALEIANFYPMQEFARLSVVLKDTKCLWFHSFQELSVACKKCGEESLVVLTGKNKPTTCKRCDSKRLERHISEFLRIQQEVVAGNSLTD